MAQSIWKWMLLLSAGRCGNVRVTQPVCADRFCEQSIRPLCHHCLTEAAPGGPAGAAPGAPGPPLPFP